MIPRQAGMPASGMSMTSVLGLVLLCLVLTPVRALAQQYTWDDVGRVVAISDVHGAFDAMVATLTNAGVIDSDRDWAAGDTHLVITGDLLDRGADSRKVMDLVLRLEEQARATGGRVHQLLGNHEVMNLVGDLRYVAPEEFAAFADEETAEERERWFRAYFIENTDQLEEPDEAALRAAFDRDRPPGFYAHRRAFSTDGQYGQWLMQKPLLVVINGTAFVHGGLSPIVSEVGLEALNRNLQSDVVAYMRQLAVLDEAGLLDPAVNFYRQPQRAEAMLANLATSEEVTHALQELIRLNDSQIHGGESPLWYRGTVGCSALIESDKIAAALDAIGAERVVIGHTPTLTRQVLHRLDGRVIEIDTGMLSTAYGGVGNALVIEGERLAVVNEMKEALLEPVPHPRRVGARDESLRAEDLARILATGEIVANSTDEAGITTVVVSAEGYTIPAQFVRNPRSRDFVPQIAAYRLDQLLGLDMVPVTVAREVDGDAGSLQFVPPDTTTEEQRSASGRGAGAWCPLPEQWDAMYVFDALVYNPGRGWSKMLYSRDNWQLILVGNEETFDTARGRPAYLKDVPLNLGDAWIDALHSLDEDALVEYFDGILSKRRVSALLRRRDRLVEDALAAH